MTQGPCPHSLLTRVDGTHRLLCLQCGTFLDAAGVEMWEGMPRLPYDPTAQYLEERDAMKAEDMKPDQYYQCLRPDCQYEQVRLVDHLASGAVLVEDMQSVLHVVRADALSQVVTPDGQNTVPCGCFRPHDCDWCAGSGRLTVLVKSIKDARYDVQRGIVVPGTKP